MRLRFLAVPLLVAAALVAPASAPAKVIVGMSENNPQLFTDPNFTALGVKKTRLVVSYNAIEANQDGELTGRVAPYLAAAAASGTEVLVSFEHARGAAEVCKKASNRKLSQCRLPSDAEYQRNVTKFLQAFPQVNVIAPWNEANHFTQPTARNPAAAARFATIVSNVCAALGRRCTIVAVDVLDAANNTKSKNPRYTTVTKWIKRFRRAFKGRRNVCGIHNYSDVNRFRTSGTKALTKALGCRRYWLTETGGLYDFGSFWSSKANRRTGRCRKASACQLKATKFLFDKIVKRTRRLERVYIYTWFGGNQPRFDAGLVQGRPGGVTKPRSAYYEIKRRLRA